MSSEIQMMIDSGFITQEDVDKEYKRRIAEFDKQYPQFAIKETEAE